MFNGLSHAGAFKETPEEGVSKTEMSGRAALGTRTKSDPYTATQKPEREKRLNKKYIKSPKEAARRGQPRMGPTAVAPSPRLLAVRLFFEC